jgi:hypothetical protein
MKNVLALEPDGRVQTVSNRFVERLFLFRFPLFVPGDLDNYEVVIARYTPEPNSRTHN